MGMKLACLSLLLCVVPRVSYSVSLCCPGGELIMIIIPTLSEEKGKYAESLVITHSYGVELRMNCVWGVGFFW